MFLRFLSYQDCFATRKAARLLINKLADELENNTETDGKMEIGELKDQIMLKDVTFSYDGKTVLKDIGLCLQKVESMLL